MYKKYFEDETYSEEGVKYKCKLCNYIVFVPSSIFCKKQTNDYLKEHLEFHILDKIFINGINNHAKN